MLSRLLAEEILTVVMQAGADYAEIFAENTTKAYMNLENGNISTIKKGVISGAGIRVIKKNQEIYASSSGISRNKLLECAEKIKFVVAGKCEDKLSRIVLPELRYEVENITPVEENTFTFMQKRNFIREIDGAARDCSPQIMQVEVTLVNSDQNINIANSEGMFLGDERIRSRLIINVTADNQRDIQNSNIINGTSKDWKYLKELDAVELGKKCATQALDALCAEPCPQGQMPIILAGGAGGTIFHEACGHPLEAGFAVYGNSVFANKLGRKIASPIVTLIDDGTLLGEFGSSKIDDEGTCCKKNILIEEGILKSYLVDKLNGKIMDMEITGNGRRENYTFAPTARMTNTYIQPGKDKEEDIIKSTDYGIYAEELNGGSVNPMTGDFDFGVVRGYLIKNGSVDRPIRGASLIGNTTDILMRIDKVGTKLSFAQGICGSKSGCIPVGMGQPMIRISEMIVGGKE